MVPTGFGKARRRQSLRWFFAGLGIFVYLLLLTWERVELKERNGRIEMLERTLQERQTDAALLRLDLDRKAGYLAVQNAAEEWGMRPVEAHQRVLLAAVEQPGAPEPASRSAPGLFVDQIRRGLSGVAQAVPSSREESDAPGQE